MRNDNKESLRSVINSGHTRGQGVLRCIGEDKVPELFPTFAPKALGMIGKKLPPPTLSRCIHIELRRRTQAEAVTKFRHVDDEGLATLRQRLARWALDNEDSLRDAKPSMPKELQNRRADNWALLLAIADLCDGAEGYGEKARAAALEIEKKSDSRSIKARLLEDIRAIFDAAGLRSPKSALASAKLVSELTKDEEKPWLTFSRGKELTQNRLAGMLADFGIASQTTRPTGQEDKTARGYYRHQFEEVWARYLGPSEPPT
jgi:putative DNA primase/helicase